MRLIAARLIAVLLLVIPGIAATYGFLLMQEAFFAALGPDPLPWLKFLAGVILFAAGVAFIGGWIFFRDRKRNYVASRFKQKKRS